LFLLAWGHLGLGSLLMPPAPTPSRQVAVAGPYRVALVLASGQLTARGPNTLVLVLDDRSGRPVAGASLHIQPWMTTMPMAARPVDVRPQAGGRYVAHIQFGMAGSWRLDVAVARPGQPVVRVVFDVGVRWG
jgi:hypothetical protein